MLEILLAFLGASGIYTSSVIGSLMNPDEMYRQKNLYPKYTRKSYKPAIYTL